MALDHKNYNPDLMYGASETIADDLTVTDTLNVSGVSTFTGNVTQTGATTFGTGTGAVSLNGNTTIAGSKTFSTGTGAVSLNGTTTMAAATAFVNGTGGTTPITAPPGISNWQPVAATSGTDTTPANGTQFVTTVYIPCNKTITNINYLIGSVGGTDKVYGVLYDSTGAVLANTSLTSGGATVGTAANLQTLALTATYAAKGPGLFYVGISMNGNTARLRTVPAHTQSGNWAGSVSQTHGTVAAITAPTTFTADKAPVVFLD